MSNSHDRRIRKLIEQMANDGLEAAQSHADVTDQLRGFSESIGASGDFAVLPITGGKGMRPLDCFNNCVQQQRSMGGAIVYGWDWHQLADLLVVAEFHSVWRSPEGDLIDLTPRAVKVAMVTFSIDPLREAPDINPSQPNIIAHQSFRFPLIDNLVGKEWIDAEDVLAAIQ